MGMQFWAAKTKVTGILKLDQGKTLEGIECFTKEFVLPFEGKGGL